MKIQVVITIKSNRSFMRAPRSPTKEQTLCFSWQGRVDVCSDRLMVQAIINRRLMEDITSESKSKQ